VSYKSHTLNHKNKGKPNDSNLFQNKEAVAIEVKSAENTKSKSAVNIINNYGVQHVIKLSTKNIYISGKIDNFPLYMAMFL